MLISKKGKHPLAELQFTGTDLSKLRIESLTRFISVTNIELLCLCDNRLNPTTFETIFASLVDNKSITRLRVSCNIMNEDNIVNLANVIE